MQKQHQHIHAFQSAIVPHPATHELERKLAQLQTQLRSMPMRTSTDYGFSLSVTRRFAQEVVADMVAWLNDTDALATEKGKRRKNA